MLIDSDFPLDKIVYLNTGSHTATGGPTVYSVQHGLPFTPLIKAVWSTDPNFSITYNIGDGVPSSNPMAPYSTQVYDLRANSTTIEVTAGRYAAGSQTVYLRIWGFMPTTFNTTAPFTSIAGDNYILNSDYNYTKLFLAGVTGSSSTGGSTETVNHNLGYYPQVEVWQEVDGWIYLQSYTQILFGAPDTGGSIINTSSLIMYRSFYISNAVRFHYRIYKDEL